MGLFKKEVRSVEDPQSLESVLFGNLKTDVITEKEALNIPTVSACIQKIAETIVSIPIYLYQEKDGKTAKIQNDRRVFLLNDETGDTLNAGDWIKAMISDYYLHGMAFSYINRHLNGINSLHYLNFVDYSTTKNADPIFKDYDVLVNGKTFYPHQFLKIFRMTKDGASGIGLLKSNQEILATTYNALKYENKLNKTGGNKKGFLMSDKKLTTDAMTELKSAWNSMYKDNTENCVVLNNGLTFKESSNTSVEMQLNENKKVNSAEICKLFGFASTILEGKASEEDVENFNKTIINLLAILEKAYNRDLLLESEKGSFYFAYDTKDLVKGTIEKRFKAYEIATKNGIMQIDEVRYREDLAPLELPFIKLGLQDVLYNVETKEIYTPNTDKTTKLKGGE